MRKPACWPAGSSSVRSTRRRFPCVCAKDAKSTPGWKSERRFTLNILEDDGSTDLIVHFGRGFGLDEPAFDGLEVERPEEAAPVLKDALAYLDCRVIARHVVGDHELFIGRVSAGATHGDGKPMVHVRKSGLHY